MAWYYGTYVCGHEGRVDIIGPTKDRRRKADRHFDSKVCDDCRQEEREKANEEARKKAEELGLKKLIGSEKQVDV